jgi:hypothetical protein
LYPSAPQVLLFHVMRNLPIRETQLLAALCAAPSLFPVRILVHHHGVDRRCAARRGWTLKAPDGSTRNLVVEAKRVVEPRDVPSVLRQFGSVRHGDDATLLVAAPYCRLEPASIWRSPVPDGSTPPETCGSSWFVPPCSSTAPEPAATPIATPTTVA